jgi:hypothetical protein
MPSHGRSGSRSGTGDDPAAGESAAELLVFQSELVDGADDHRDAETRCRSFHMHDRAHPNATPRSRADRTPLCFKVKGEALMWCGSGLQMGWLCAGAPSSFPAAGIIGSLVAASRTPCWRRCAAGLRPVLDPASRSHGMAAAREWERRGS